MVDEKSPEETVTIYVIVAVAGAVVLFIIMFVCCAIYQKNKEREEKIKPLMVGRTVFKLNFHWFHPHIFPYFRAHLAYLLRTGPFISPNPLRAVTLTDLEANHHLAQERLSRPHICRVRQTTPIPQTTLRRI